MTFSYPFYGRVFDIISRWRIRPWFKGADGTARYMNAIGLVCIHQNLALLAALSGYAKLAGYKMDLGYAVAICLIAALLAFNMMALRRRPTPSRTNRFVDIAHMLVYAVTFVGFGVVIAQSRPL